MGKMYRIRKKDKDKPVFQLGDSPEDALEAAGIKENYCSIEEVTNEMIDEMEDDELELMDEAYPEEVLEKVQAFIDELTRAGELARLAGKPRTLDS